MINLGPYSGGKCPNVHYHPVLPDRMLEGAALLLVLATWGIICWLYIYKVEIFSSTLWGIGASSSFCFLLIGGCSYLPVRFFNFPVRVSERNIGVQYLLAVRLTRVVNVLLSLIFLSGVLTECFDAAGIMLIASLILLSLAFVGYYILAFRCK